MTRTSPVSAAATATRMPPTRLVGRSQARTRATNSRPSATTNTHGPSASHSTTRPSSAAVRWNLICSSSGAGPELRRDPLGRGLTRDPGVAGGQQPGLLDALAGERAPRARRPGVVEEALGGRGLVGRTGLEPTDQRVGRGQGVGVETGDQAQLAGLL